MAKQGIIFLLTGMVTSLLYSNITYANSSQACDAIFIGTGNVESEENCGFIGAGAIGYESPFTNDTEVNFLPIVTVVWEDFYIDGAEAGLLFWNDISLTDYYLVTAFVRLASDGYKADDEPQLTGLKDTNEAVEAGVRLNWGGSWGKVNLSVAHDVSSKHESFVADVNYGYSWQVSDITIALSLKAAFQTSDVANYYYGVSEAQVAANRPFYEVGSVINLSAGYFVNKPINNEWSLIHFAQFTRYADDINNSPLTVNDNGFSVGGGAVYLF